VSTTMTHHDDARASSPRFQVTFWPGRPRKTPPGTVGSPPPDEMSPLQQARGLLEAWRFYRERGLDLALPKLGWPKRPPRIVRARARGHGQRSRARRTLRRSGCRERAGPGDDPSCEERPRSRS
jgi:hypothetical protein